MEAKVSFAELPQPVKGVCKAFVVSLNSILQTKLYGIYMYGAAVFPDSGPVKDIDCHVILTAPLTDRERTNIVQLFESLSKRFPPLGGEVDAWFILADDARKTSPPTNQLRPDMHDESWALHCAHIRAGRYLTLYGPEPVDIFSAPSWRDVSNALDYEMRFIEANLKYPAYCVLNLCRIVYSFQERDAVVSKRFSGAWARDRFSHWAPLIEAALKYYDGKATLEDEKYLQTEIGPFLSFASERIREAREPHS